MGDTADYLLCDSAKVSLRGQISPWQEEPRGRQQSVGLSAGGGGWGVGTGIWVHMLVLPLISRVKVRMEKLIQVSQGCGEDEWKVISMEGMQSETTIHHVYLLLGAHMETKTPPKLGPWKLR